MNCRPGDLAYVDLPAHVQMRDQVQGFVVSVLGPAPQGEGRVPGPLWFIAPALVFVCDKHYRTPDGLHDLRPGDRFTCNSFPDEYLRPIRGQSEDESVATEKELENVC